MVCLAADPVSARSASSRCYPQRSRAAWHLPRPPQPDQTTGWPATAFSSEDLPQVCSPHRVYWDHRARNLPVQRVSTILALQASSGIGSGRELAATATPVAYYNLARWPRRRISTAEAVVPDLALSQGRRALAPSHLLFGEDAPVRLKTVAGLASQHLAWLSLGLQVLMAAMMPCLEPALIARSA